MATSYKPWFLVACTLFLAASCNGLQVGFYQKTCPRAEAIVRAEVEKAVRRDPGLGAALIRMLFHDCFVQGCDGSILLDRTPANPLPEKMGAPNNPSQRGFDVIDAAKAALEKACPRTVSCADIIAFGARDASSILSGSKISFQMPGGRFDGRRSLESDTGGALPGPSSDLSTLLRRFADKGLSADDLVVLSGAHSVGRSHCTSFFRDRIASPSDMAAPLVSALRRQCPTNPTFTNNAVVAEDAVTPNVLDNQYYTNVLQSRVLFPSDAALLSSRQTASMVQSYARSPGLWERKFAAAMVKMASIEVKTARNGEIRRSCKVVN